MAEVFTLTTPEVIPAVSTPSYALVFLLLDWENAYIVIRLRSATGQLKEFSYGSAAPGLATPAEKAKATALMVGLNKANLTVKSLQRRVLEQLTTDGLLAGAITGAPD